MDTPSQNTEEVNPVEKQNHTHFFSTGIIVALLILGAIAFYTAIQKKPVQPTTHSMPSVALTDVTLTQQSATSAAVIVTTNTNHVTGIQFDLSYNPASLSVDNIKAGDLFSSSTILLKTIDNVHGKTSFAIGISPNALAITGTGPAAIILFTPKLHGQEVMTFSGNPIVSGKESMHSLLHKANGVILSL